MKKGYSIEKNFKYPEEGEVKWVWCPGIVERSPTMKKDNMIIVATVKS